MLASVELLIGAAHLADVWPVFSASVTLLLLVTFLIFTVLMLNKGVSVPCMCFGGADAEPVSLRSIVRIGLLIIAEVAVVVGNTWIFSGTEGQSFTVSDRLYEALAGGSTVLIVSWALSVTDLVSMKGCKECRSTKRRRHVSRWRKEHVAPSL